LLWGLWRKSVPAPIFVYAVTLALLSLATSGYFGSKPRYLLPAFPLLIPIAIYINKGRSGNQKYLLAGIALISFIYSAIWLTGSGPL